VSVSPIEPKRGAAGFATDASWRATTAASDATEPMNGL
jgi:hypothetical protein